MPRRRRHPDDRILGVATREIDGELCLAKTYRRRGIVGRSAWEEVGALGDVTTAMLDGVLELLCIARPKRRLTVYVPDVIAHAVLTGRRMPLSAVGRMLLREIREEERKLLKRPTYRRGLLLSPGRSPSHHSGR